MRPLLFSAALVALGLVAGVPPRRRPPVRTDQVNVPPCCQFDPAVIEVVAGTSVTWTHNDHFTLRQGAGRP